MNDLKCLQISGGKLSANIVKAGAALVDLNFDGHPNSLILRHAQLATYRENPSYMGAIVGRFANRIRNAEFSQDGKKFQLDANDQGKHCLHGGGKGIAFQHWEIIEHGSNFLTMSVIDSYENSGFPGDCQISLTYKIIDEACLEISLSAQCNEATPCSLTAHPYFNLGPDRNTLNHKVQIFADTYLPIDTETLPTGDVLKVEETSFDLRTPQKLVDQVEAFDHNFCITNERHALNKMAYIYSPESGMSLTVYSNETGLQFYTGSGLSRDFLPNEGLCLEPQAWPDAPNRSEFPDCILRPEETYEHTIRYEFAKL